MRIFLYEFITGGGLLKASPASAPAPSLLAEGQAMIAALADDFLALPGSSPHIIEVLRDARFAPSLFSAPSAAPTNSPRNPAHALNVHEIENETAALDAFAQLAANCDFTLLIAPETNGELLARARAVLAAGGRLLSPAPEFISLTANKQATAERLAASGVPTPLGRLLAPGESLPSDFPYPAILKPNDGCGSCGVQLVSSAAAERSESFSSSALRLERFCPGQACSMAVLCGPQYAYPLQLMTQTLTNDGHFSYLGGEYAFDENKENRARRLVKAALKALPPVAGYVGFDLVLGPTDDGRHDVIIEINPRLTTSYIGQRQVFLTNLPHMLLETVAGRWPHGRFSTRSKLAFTSSGVVTRP